MEWEISGKNLVHFLKVPAEFPEGFGKIFSEFWKDSKEIRDGTGIVRLYRKSISN